VQPKATAPHLDSTIRVIPAIAACPVRPNRGHLAKGTCLMSTVAITLAISSVAPVEAQQQKRWCCVGPREKDRAAPSAIFSKNRKAIWTRSSSRQLGGTRQAKGVSPHHGACFFGMIHRRAEG
jgi:hypothetical protein